MWSSACIGEVGDNCFVDVFDVYLNMQSFRFLEGQEASINGFHESIRTYAVRFLFSSGGRRLLLFSML